MSKKGQSGVERLLPYLQQLQEIQAVVFGNNYLWIHCSGEGDNVALSATLFYGRNEEGEKNCASFMFYPWENTEVLDNKISFLKKYCND